MPYGRLKSQILSCDECKREFHPDPHFKRHAHHFCSKACANEYRKIYEICDNCGKTFHKKERKRTVFEHNFCSRACYWQWIKTQKHYREEARRTAFAEKIAKQGRIRWQNCSTIEKEKWLKQIINLGKKRKGKTRPDNAERNRLLKSGSNNPRLAWRC